MHAYLAELLHVVDEEVGLVASEHRLAGHLDELVSLIEALPLDLEHAGKPFGITARVADQVPDAGAGASTSICSRTADISA